VQLSQVGCARFCAHAEFERVQLSPASNRQESRHKTLHKSIAFASIVEMKSWASLCSAPTYIAWFSSCFSPCLCASVLRGFKMDMPNRYSQVGCARFCAHAEFERVQLSPASHLQKSPHKTLHKSIAFASIIGMKSRASLCSAPI